MNTHLVRGSITSWDCKYFVEKTEKGVTELQCIKNHGVCEGRRCPDFKAKLEELEK